MSGSQSRDGTVFQTDLIHLKLNHKTFSVETDIFN